MGPETEWMMVAGNFVQACGELIKTSKPTWLEGQAIFMTSEQTFGRKEKEERG